MLLHLFRLPAILVLLSLPLVAQVPTIAELPDCAGATDRSRLAPERAALLERRTQLRARTTEHNGRCRQRVRSGQPTHVGTPHEANARPCCSIRCDPRIHQSPIARTKQQQLHKR